MRKLSAVASLSALVVALASLSAFFPVPTYAGCSPVPPMPTRVWASSGPGAGEVTLSWDQVPHANRYAIAYGTHSNSYMYGSTNIGGSESTRYTVKSLAPGQTYYFRLAAARDCSSSPFSAELSARAGGGTVSAASGDMMAAQPVTATTSPAVFSGPVGKLMLSAKSGPGVGQVTLYWKDADGANNYHLMYGTEHGKFQYGALSIGNLHSFTVGKLAAGRVYHFALVPLMGNRPLYTTDQVMAAAYSMPVEPVQEPVGQSMGNDDDLPSVNVVEAEEMWENADESQADDTASIYLAEPETEDDDEQEEMADEVDDTNRVGAPEGEDPGLYLVAPDEDAVSDDLYMEDQADQNDESQVSGYNGEGDNASLF